MACVNRTHRSNHTHIHELTLTHNSCLLSPPSQASFIPFPSVSLFLLHNSHAVCSFSVSLLLSLSLEHTCAHRHTESLVTSLFPSFSSSTCFSHTQASSLEVALCLLPLTLPVLHTNTAFSSLFSFSVSHSFTDMHASRPTSATSFLSLSLDFHPIHLPSSTSCCSLFSLMHTLSLISHIHLQL